MDEESMLELRIDLHEQKLDQLTSQVQDLSQSIYSMKETLDGFVKSMGMTMVHDVKQQDVKQQEREMNSNIMASRRRGGDGHVEGWTSWQTRLLDLDRRIQLLHNQNKEQGSTNFMGEGENPSSKVCWKNRDSMVEPKPQIEPKILNQMVAGMKPKRSIDFGKPNRSVTVSKPRPQPNNMGHQLTVTPKLLLLHRFIIPKNYFIDYCFEVSGFWGAYKLFNEGIRLNRPGETEFAKFCGVWYTVWGRKPSKPPDFKNLFGASYALCGRESLKPPEPPDYMISSTHQHSSSMSNVTPLESPATTLSLVLKVVVSASLSSLTYVNYQRKKPVKQPNYNPNSSIIEPLRSKTSILEELNQYSGKQESYGDHEFSVALGRNSSQILSQPSFDVSNNIIPSFQIASATGHLKDSKETKYPCMRSNVSLVHLAHINKPEIPVTLLGSVVAVDNGVLFPISRNLLSAIIKSFFKPAHELRNDTEFWDLMLLGLILAGLEVTPFSTYLFGITGCMLIRKDRLIYFDMVQMKISWFDKTGISSLLINAKWSADAVYVRGLVGNGLSLLFQNTVSAISELIIVFMAKWQLVYIVEMLLPLLGLDGYLLLTFLNEFSADAKKKFKEANEVGSVAVGSIRIISSFGAQDEVMKLQGKKCEGSRRAGLKQGLISGAGLESSMFFLLVYTFSSYIGAPFIGVGKATIPTIFQEFLESSVVATGVSQSGFFVPNFGKAKTVAASVFDLLDQKSKIDYIDDSGITLENVKGDFEFSHDSFMYLSRPHIQTFKDFCLDILSGQKIAQIRSGKSMVVYLLQLFYDADLGQILFDGVDIQKLKVKWSRQQMDLVSQEPFLFNDTRKGPIPGQFSYFRLEDKPSLYGGGIDREYDMGHFLLNHQPNGPRPAVRK